MDTAEYRPHRRALPDAIPGRPLDPPQKFRAETARKLDGKVATAGVVYRAIFRFNKAKTTVLAAGTTYYIFISLFAMITFAYGIAATLGADRIAEALTEYLGEAFPGLIGADGIDPEELKATGQTTSTVGLLVLVYSGSGAVAACASSMHMIYGAPQDPRNFVFNRIRYLMWLFLLGPLIVVSYIPSTFVTAFLGPLIDRFELQNSGVGAAIVVASLILTYILNFLIVYLVLSNLGGIRPSRRARVIGAAVGALVLEILKYVASIIIQRSLDNPAYGAFAIPIALMLVLYLQTITLFGSAALTAAVARHSVGAAPGEPLTPEQVERGLKDMGLRKSHGGSSREESEKGSVAQPDAGGHANPQNGTIPGGTTNP